MDLKDKIKQLSERLDADKPKPVAQEKQKPVERIILLPCHLISEIKQCKKCCQIWKH